jgi:TonB family protein
MSAVLTEYALRSTGILLVVFAVLPALRRSSASLRHTIVCTAVGAALLVVPIGRAVPWTLPVPISPETMQQVAAAVPGDSTVLQAPAVVAAAAAPTDQRPSLAAVTVALWVAGFAWLAARRIRALLDLRRAALAARPVDAPTWNAAAGEIARAIGLSRPVRLLSTDRPELLATWGLASPRLAVPAHALGWDDAKVRAVLAHELEHVRRRDWIVQLAADVARDANWWNPLFWWASRRLRLESERACDDAVLRAGMAGRDYAAHLIDIARACGSASRAAHPAAAMARRSTLHRRIDAMLNPRLPRSAVSFPLAALVVVSMLAVAFSVAGLRAQDSAAQPLTGVLYDPDGAVLPEVDVVLDNGRGEKSTARTDASGRFSFPPIPAGRYVLRVNQPGFKALAQTVELRQPKDWSPSLVLQVGDVQETVTVRSARIGSTAPAAQPLKVRVGGNIRPPMKLKDVRPEYPDAMRAAGEEGTVLLDTIIATDGSVQSIRVVRSPAHRALVDAAIAAVRGWKFEPTLLNGSPVEVVMRVSVDFELEGE